MPNVPVIKPDPEPVTPAVRRAPYSDNPTVGARGLRTQQRILDAALHAFGDHGYERTTIEQIAQLAGCSRVSFYQYFADKEDVFRQLAGQVARQLRASAEALEPLSPDAAGWSALRAWVARYSATYSRFEPVFRAFDAATESDASLVGGSARVGGRNVALFQSKLSTTTLPPRQLDPVVALLLSSVHRSLDIASILRSAHPDSFPGQRVEDAIADVVHRALFGLLPDVNAHASPLGAPPPLPFDPGLLDGFRRAAELERESMQPGRRALASLIGVGHDVLVRHGYHGTRVDDLVAAAGVSHGAFYRYFANKDEFVQLVAVRALDAVAQVMADVPGSGADRTTIRRWLRRYHAVTTAQGAMIRVWVDAGLAGESQPGARAAAFDWGRRQARHLLDDRGFGDVEADALVLIGVVQAAGADLDSPPFDAAVRVVERGLLGRRE